MQRCPSLVWQQVQELRCGAVRRREGMFRLCAISTELQNSKSVISLIAWCRISFMMG